MVASGREEQVVEARRRNVKLDKPGAARVGGFGWLWGKRRLIRRIRGPGAICEVAGEKGARERCGQAVRDGGKAPRDWDMRERVDSWTMELGLAGMIERLWTDEDHADLGSGGACCRGSGGSGTLASTPSHRGHRVTSRPVKSRSVSIHEVDALGGGVGGACSGSRGASRCLAASSWFFVAEAA